MISNCLKLFSKVHLQGHSTAKRITNDEKSRRRSGLTKIDPGQRVMSPSPRQVTRGSMGSHKPNRWCWEIKRQNLQCSIHAKAFRDWICFPTIWRAIPPFRANYNNKADKSMRRPIRINSRDHNKFSWSTARKRKVAQAREQPGL